MREIKFQKAKKIMENKLKELINVYSSDYMVEDGIFKVILLRISDNKIREFVQEAITLLGKQYKFDTYLKQYCGIESEHGFYRVIFIRQF